MTKRATRDGAPERLRALQQAFAGHIRNPDAEPAPADVEARRMKIYNELFFNNINKFVTNNFPVLRSLYRDGDWDRLVREFFTEHRCQTPLFPELPREFLRYIQEKRQNRPGDPPFLHELAHYEWVELALALDERDHGNAQVDADTDLLDGVPVLSPLAWPLSYRYPVNEIRPDFQPTEPPESVTHLLVYRNRQDEVKFMRLNDVSRLLLEMMREEDQLTGREMLEGIAQRIEHPDPERVIEGGSQLLEELLSKDIVLGSVSRRERRKARTGQGSPED